VAATSHTRSAPGCSTGAENLIRAAHLVLIDAGITMGPRRVNKLVRDYQARVEKNGYDFFAFLANAVQLSAEQRRRALRNPDIARVISYTDRTGEEAVTNVMRELKTTR
jgi:hypothetical protein